MEKPKSSEECSSKRVCYPLNNRKRSSATGSSTFFPEISTTRKSCSWTNRDRVQLLQGVVGLTEHSNSIAEDEAQELIENQNSAIKQLKTEVTEFQEEVRSLKHGRKARKTLKDNKELYLAVNHLSFESAKSFIEEHVMEWNKKLNAVTYQRKKAEKKIEEFQREVEVTEKLEMRKKKQEEAYKRDLNTYRSIGAQIENLNLQKTIAENVNRTYLSILNILKQEKMSYESQLKTLHDSENEQNRCCKKLQSLVSDVKKSGQGWNKNLRQTEASLKVHYSVHDAQVDKFEEALSVLYRACERLIAAELNVDDGDELARLRRSSSAVPATETNQLSEVDQNYIQQVQNIMETTGSTHTSDIFMRLLNQADTAFFLVHERKCLMAKNQDLLSKRFGVEIQLEALKMDKKRYRLEDQETNLKIKIIEVQKKTSKFQNRKTYINTILTHLLSELYSLSQNLAIGLGQGELVPGISQEGRQVFDEKKIGEKALEYLAICSRQLQELEQKTLSTDTPALSEVYDPHFKEFLLQRKHFGQTPKPAVLTRRESRETIFDTLHSTESNEVLSHSSAKDMSKRLVELKSNLRKRNVKTNKKHP